MKVILTGATGMVGEGVLLACLENPLVTHILIVGRRPYGRRHPKIAELVLADFRNASEVKDQVSGYDACFFCAGVTSIGKNEEQYRLLTYDTTLAFARVIRAQNAPWFLPM